MLTSEIHLTFNDVKFWQRNAFRQFHLAIRTHFSGLIMFPDHKHHRQRFPFVDVYCYILMDDREIQTVQNMIIWPWKREQNSDENLSPWSNSSTPIKIKFPTGFVLSMEFGVVESECWQQRYRPFSSCHRPTRSVCTFWWRVVSWICTLNIPSSAQSSWWSWPAKITREVEQFPCILRPNLWSH